MPVINTDLNIGVMAMIRVKQRARYILGKNVMQPIWERLYKLSLIGMNVGTDGTVNNSGEGFVIDHWMHRHADTRMPVVFDVGANVGNYTSALLSRMKTDVQVYCFEPSLVTFNTLSSNLGQRSGVNLINMGLSNCEADLDLYANKDVSGLSSLYARYLQHLNLMMNQSEKVHVTTLDKFCDQHNISNISLLKIDVEGHELNVLEGASHTIERGNIDIIQFEFGGCNIDSRTYFRDFYSLLCDRFDIYRVVRDGIRRIDQYSEVFELFTTTNYMAIKKR